MYDPEFPNHRLPSGRGVATAEAGDRRPGTPIDAHRMRRVLRRARFWLLAAALLGTAGGGALALFVVPRDWVAVASLVYEGVPEVAGIPTPGDTDLPTMVDSVKLPANMRAVRERLSEDAPIDELGQKIEVSVEANSNVMNITARDGAAEDAAALANAAVAVFLEHRVEVERVRLQEHLDVLEEDIRLARDAHAQARTRYDAFREEHGISDFTAEQEHAIEAAAALRAEADMARADAQSEDARLRELSVALRQQSRTVVTEVQTSPEELELARVRGELAQAQASLSPDHPRVRALEQRVATAAQRVAAGGARTVADRTVSTSPGFEALQGSVQGTAAAREAARQREQTLEERLNAARERLSALSVIEGEASTLLAAVTVAEEHSNALGVRQRALEDALRSPSSGFRVVSEAMPPEQPAEGKARWAMVVALPLLLVLLVLGVFGSKELRGLKIVTPREVGYWANGPVLGATAWPRTSHDLYELASELDDHFPDALGSTLVVGATDHEAKYARQLADWLKDDWQPTVTVGKPAESTPSTPPAPRRSGAALAVREPAGALAAPATIEIAPYSGEEHAGPRLRRAVRLADRVIVVVESGRHSAIDLNKLRARLGRVDMRVGFIVVNLPDELRELPDRAGDVERFWRPATARHGHESAIEEDAPTGEAA